MGLPEESKRAMDMVFETFKRTSRITCYKTPQRDILMFDSDFNADFENPESASIRETSRSESFDAVVIWPRARDLAQFFKGDPTLSVKAGLPNGLLTIRVGPDAYEYLKDGKAVFFNGIKYLFHSEFLGIGMFGEIQRYEAVLIRDV